LAIARNNKKQPAIAMPPAGPPTSLPAIRPELFDYNFCNNDASGDANSYGGPARLVICFNK
jgi:hypothetical protein